VGCAVDRDVQDHVRHRLNRDTGLALCAAIYRCQARQELRLFRKGKG
jgi:hypothetical protein